MNGTSATKFFSRPRHVPRHARHLVIPLVRQPRRLLYQFLLRRPGKRLVCRRRCLGIQKRHCYRCRRRKIQPQRECNTGANCNLFIPLRRVPWLQHQQACRPFPLSRLRQCFQLRQRCYVLGRRYGNSERHNHKRHHHSGRPNLLPPAPKLRRFCCVLEKWYSPVYPIKSTDSHTSHFTHEPPVRRLIFSFRARFSGQTRQKKRDHSPLSADHGLFLYIVGLHLSDVGLSAKSSAASSLETPWMTLHTPIIIPYSLRKIGRTLDHGHHNLFRKLRRFQFLVKLYQKTPEKS